MSRFQTRREAKLKQLALAKPLVAASLCRVARRCGHPNCKCARGEPHTAHVLTYKVKGKTKTVHVPKDMVEEVTQWVEEHKRIKKLLREISDLSLTIIRRHVPVSRAVGRNSRRSQS
jgi:excinuclease UvrABC ATPase subunit